MDLLGVRHGFGFSAGLFDYVLNYGLSTRGWMILPVGAAYFVIYYAVFRWFILRFDLPTPGRAAGEEQEAAANTGTATAVTDEAQALVLALGGRANLLDIDACTTRLRLRVADQSGVDEARLKALGAAGVLRPTPDTVQVIVGLRADELATRMREVGDVAASKPVPGIDSHDLLAALGGVDNILQAEACGTRLSLQVRDAAAVQVGPLASPGLRALIAVGPQRFHLLADSDTSALAAALEKR
jgi:PTS system N-acetylglucosamine-specific IIC component